MCNQMSHGSDDHLARPVAIGSASRFRLGLLSRFLLSNRVLMPGRVTNFCSIFVGGCP
jgi:hypothetical protein